MKKLLAALLLISFLLPATAHAAEKESAYDHVMRTKTLRCGNLPFEPFIIKDPNTGKMSGMTVDYVNAVAARLGLKVEWGPDTNIDQFKPTLDAGRFDAICVPCSSDDIWEKNFEFTGFAGVLPYYVYVPVKSTLTKKQLETATFATVDGYALTDITVYGFPKAHYASLPQTTSAADMFNQLKFGKADAHVNENVSGGNFMRNNPGVVRKFSDTPVAAQRFYMLTPKGDAKMAEFFNKNFDVDLPTNTELFKTLKKKYAMSDDSFLSGESCPKTITVHKPDGVGWPICADQ